MVKKINLLFCLSGWFFSALTLLFGASSAAFNTNHWLWNLRVVPYDRSGWPENRVLQGGLLYRGYAKHAVYCGFAGSWDQGAANSGGRVAYLYRRKACPLDDPHLSADLNFYLSADIHPLSFAVCTAVGLHSVYKHSYTTLKVDLPCLSTDAQWSVYLEGSSPLALCGLARYFPLPISLSSCNSLRLGDCEFSRFSSTAQLPLTVLKILTGLQMRWGLTLHLLEGCNLMLSTNLAGETLCKAFTEGAGWAKVYNNLSLKLSFSGGFGKPYFRAIRGKSPQFRSDSYLADTAMNFPFACKLKSVVSEPLGVEALDQNAELLRQCSGGSLSPFSGSHPGGAGTLDTCDRNRPPELCANTAVLQEQLHRNLGHQADRVRKVEELEGTRSAQMEKFKNGEMRLQASCVDAQAKLGYGYTFQSKFADNGSLVTQGAVTYVRYTDTGLDRIDDLVTIHGQCGSEGLKVATQVVRGGVMQGARQIEGRPLDVAKELWDGDERRTITDALGNALGLSIDERSGALRN